MKLSFTTPKNRRSYVDTTHVPSNLPRTIPPGRAIVPENQTPPLTQLPYLPEDHFFDSTPDKRSFKKKELDSDISMYINDMEEAETMECEAWLEEYRACAMMKEYPVCNSCRMQPCQTDQYSCHISLYFRELQKCAVLNNRERTIVCAHHFVFVDNIGLETANGEKYLPECMENCILSAFPPECMET